MYSWCFCTLYAQLYDSGKNTKHKGVLLWWSYVISGSSADTPKLSKIRHWYQGLGATQKESRWLWPHCQHKISIIHQTLVRSPETSAVVFQALGIVLTSLYVAFQERTTSYIRSAHIKMDGWVSSKGYDHGVSHQRSTSQFNGDIVIYGEKIIIVDRRFDEVTSHASWWLSLTSILIQLV